MSSRMIDDSLDVRDVRERLARVFRPDAARDADQVYQFRVDGRDAFHLWVRAGSFDVGAGPHPQPSVTFLFDDIETALGIVAGEQDAISAFMAGRVRTDGNLILALQLGRLFRP